MRAVAIEPLAGVLKCHFHYLIVVERPWNVPEPVLALQLSSHLFGAEVAARVVTSFAAVALWHRLRAATAAFNYTFLFIVAHRFSPRDNSLVYYYLAKLTARVSRITVIRT